MIRTSSATAPAPRDDALEILGKRLDALPEAVFETKRVPLGAHHGLSFGIELYPNGAAEVFLEGAAIRRGLLSREARGPARRPQRPRSPHRQLPRAMRRRPPGTRYRRRPSNATTRPASACPSRTSPSPRIDRPARPAQGRACRLQRNATRRGDAVRRRAGRPHQRPESRPDHRGRPLRTSPKRTAAEEPVTTRIRRRTTAPEPEPIPGPEAAEAPSPPLRSCRRHRAAAGIRCRCVATKKLLCKRIIMR